MAVILSSLFFFKKKMNRREKKRVEVLSDGQFTIQYLLIRMIYLYEHSTAKQRREGGKEAKACVIFLRCGTVSVYRRSIVPFDIFRSFFCSFRSPFSNGRRRRRGAGGRRFGIDEGWMEKGALSVINRPGLAAYHRTRGEPTTQRSSS